MLQIVMRSSIDMRSTTGAGVFVGEADAALHAEAADDFEDDVLRVDAGARACRSLRCGARSAVRARGTATRARRAPARCRCRRRRSRSAPCVEVWESPHAMVMPGCVSPSSGPITWTMPWLCVRQVVERHAEVAAVAFEGADSMASAMGSRERPGGSRVGTMWSTVANVRCGKRTASREAGARRRPAGW